MILCLWLRRTLNGDVSATQHLVLGTDIHFHVVNV